MTTHGRIAALIAICALHASAAAETIVVDPAIPGGCSQGRRQDREAAFCDLQAAIDSARPGDLIEVSPGEYGPAEIRVRVSGTAERPIVIRARPARSAVIVGPAGSGENDGCGVRISGSHIVFEGFEVRESAGTGIRNSGSHVVIRDNFVHHNARRCDPRTIPKCGQGIASNSSVRTPGVVIERNVSAWNGSGGHAQDHGFYLHGPGMVVRNNIAVGSDDFGFQIYPDCDDCLVYNNVAWGNGRSGFLFGGDDHDGTYSENVMIANNISMRNGQAGYAFYQPGGRPMMMRSNIAFENGAAAVLVPPGYSGLDNAGLIESDPLFLDPAALDFHLRPGSPAIDAGDPRAVPPDDIDGDRRVIGKGVDIGADERVGDGRRAGRGVEGG